MLPDLNSDVGESWHDRVVGDDAAIIPLLDRANVACGGHGGDPETMLRAVELCAQQGVKLGAHLSYKDLDGFGRVALDVPAAELRAELLTQLRSLSTVANRVGGPIDYVKPHGALYNQAQVSAAIASTVAGAVSRFEAESGFRLPLMGLPGSAIERAARVLGLSYLREGYADRGYNQDGTLIARGEAGALLETPSEVSAAVSALLERGGIDCICVHSDLPGALDRVRAARAVLDLAREAQGS